MRIPSEFNSDSLYRRGKRPATGSGPSYRRLLRLFVCLVLVVLVMKEAARPQWYESFFAERDNVRVVDAPPTPGHATGFTGDTDVSPTPRTSESQDAVDQAKIDEMMKSVVDGAVWHGDDFQPLCFLLAGADRIEPSECARISVLPLLQQPEVYRGRPVRFHGTVMRCEPVSAAENPYNIDRYWKLWMLPADKGERPLLGVVRDVPPDIASIGNDGEPVKAIVIGRFFKRLAYRSSIGADLAPVVVGALLAGDDDGQPTPASTPVTTTTKTQRFTGIVLACLAGVALAALAMWRTSVSARRARQLRQESTNRSATFLRQLSDERIDPK